MMQNIGQQESILPSFSLPKESNKTLGTIQLITQTIIEGPANRSRATN